MKIDKVETTLIGAETRNWVIVQITTDEGIAGIGEATLEGRGETVATAVNEMARYLVGKDPSHIERHFQYIYRGQFWKGGPVLLSALSGIDQALWDIMGKTLNRPVYQLLGGPVRDRVRLYANGWMHGIDSVDEAAKKAVVAVNRGFKALKLPGFHPHRELSGKSSYSWGVECARAVRAAVGPDVELFVDMHGRSNPSEAIAVAREYTKLNILFFEEPVPPENVSALLEVKQHSGLRIATGERLYSRFGFREVLERRAADILQPDLCHCGGILEAKKIAAMAEAYYVLVCPHNPNGPVSTTACAHFAMSTQNFEALEYFVEDVPWREKIFCQPYQVEDGYLILSDKPGLGIEMNLTEAAKHPYDPKDLPVCLLPDGTVAEW